MLQKPAKVAGLAFFPADGPSWMERCKLRMGEYKLQVRVEDLPNIGSRTGAMEGCRGQESIALWGTEITEVVNAPWLTTGHVTVKAS